MNSPNNQMRVAPQLDGSLGVEYPDENTIYDMGNRRLFVTFDGRGGARRIVLTDGYYAGAWQIQWMVENAPLVFSRARGIGKGWELDGEQDGIAIHLDCYLEETTPIVFQLCRVTNSTSQFKRVQIVLDLDVALRVAPRERQDAADALERVLQPRSAHMWGEGLAKNALPDSPRGIQLHPPGRIEAQGEVPCVWQATESPRIVHADDYSVQIVFDLDVASGVQAEVSWVYGAVRVKELDDALARRDKALADAQRHAEWLNTRVRLGDPLLQSLFVAGLNCAVAMFKEFPDDWAGLVAGPDYAYPPRLYFRDGYWTAQVLLPFRPDLVRRHLVCLARGVHTDGQCPSGIFLPHLLTWTTPGPGWLDWLPDHYDSPALFVLLLSDYVRATADWAILNERIPMWSRRDSTSSESTMWAIAQRALNYLIGCDRDGDGLIEKPYAANDWSDNVRRSVWVTYDQALFAAALFTASDIAAHRSENELSAFYQHHAQRARAALNSKLWDAARGHYINYARTDFVENHFSIDTLVALRYGLADEWRAAQLLSAARRLHTRENVEQGMGDWGIMDVYPLYKNARDLFGKTAEPYHYHNGAGWPYWDGVYSAILLQRGEPDWRYVLTRWWEYGLEQAWLTPVEYYSPRYPHGGMLQGWSAMPAAALAQAFPTNASLETNVVRRPR